MVVQEQNARHSSMVAGFGKGHNSSRPIKFSCPRSTTHVTTRVLLPVVPHLAEHWERRGRMGGREGGMDGDTEYLQMTSKWSKWALVDLCSFSS